MDRCAHQAANDARAARRVPTATQRADARWGLERVLLVHGAPPATADRDLARTLQRALRHLPVVMLHDRLLPTGVVLEHLAIGPAGVTVVAGAGELTSPLEVQLLHGMFGARAEVLWDGVAGDRTALVEPVREQVEALRALIDDFVDVHGALCLADDGAPQHLRALEVDGIIVAGPTGVARLAARDGDLHDYELATVVDLLDACCPPALG